MGDTLNEGQKLEKGGSLSSNNGAYTVTLQDDGNLVLAARGKAVWATNTSGQNIVRAEVQKDGNFVLYTSDKPVWHTDTKGKKDVRLVLQDDRNLVLYAADGAAWSSQTRTDGPPPPEPAAQIREAEVAPAAVEQPAPAPPPPPQRRAPTRWSRVTRCGRSRNGSTATAASTRESPRPAGSPIPT